jgi:hypothetical protein
MSWVLCILRKGRRCRDTIRRKYSHQFHVQIQRCVVWKVCGLDEIRYDNKLKEEDHKENIDNNDNKDEIEPPPDLLQMTGLGLAWICYHCLLMHELL